MLAVASCGKPDLNTHEGIGDALIVLMGDLADTLDGVKDAKTATASRTALMKIADRSRAIWVAHDKLGKAEAEQEAQLKNRMDKVLARVDASVNRVRDDEDIGAVMEPILDEFHRRADPRTAKLRRVTNLVGKMSRLKQIFVRLKARNKDSLPMKDGALDVYALVREGKIAPTEYALLRAPESKKLPTAKQIERGDYTHFPYERHRGTGKFFTNTRFPLLWDKKPDADGRIAVLMNLGAVRAMTKEELAEALGEK
ncbi:MAG: hypothetical protein AAGD14_18570 [Planctomycetota bacterium]